MFSMGNEELGLTYTNEDGKPVCVIYEHGQIAAKVPVELAGYVFEVHGFKLFWHDRGSGNWSETERFWSFCHEAPSGLTNWKAAQLIARIESVYLSFEVVPLLCKQCKFITTVGPQSTCALKGKCTACISLERANS